MFARVRTAALRGVEACPVVVEADLEHGMPVFRIIGLLDVTVRESRERVRSAFAASGFTFPSGRTTVSLSPAGIRKRGGHYDLAIAASLLIASGQMFPDAAEESCLIGELALDGRVNRVPGVLPLACAMRRAGIRKFFVPAGNAEEASMVEDADIYPVRSLREFAAHWNHEKQILPYQPGEALPHGSDAAAAAADFSDVSGQESAKRAICIAAAGGHALLMVGGPASGKTMLCERIPGILPEMSPEEKLETTMIWSAAGMLNDEMPSVQTRPFRRPGRGVTIPALLGGGIVPKPGEVSLAHNGVLFLDEACEFSQESLDSLRTPIERGVVGITRFGERYTFPARFLLILATNPCKCGYFGDPHHPCSCTPLQIRNYQARLSGPLLDRIDMQISLPPVSYRSISGGKGMGTAEMRKLVLRARKAQRKRFGRIGRLNASLTAGEIRDLVRLDPETERLLRKAYDAMPLDPRTLFQTERLARTIADLEGEEEVRTADIMEALGYRKKWRQEERADLARKESTDE